MCIQYLTSCVRCQADIDDTTVKCPWTDIPKNCKSRILGRLSGLAAICTDCWLLVNTEYLSRLDEEQLPQEIRDAKLQEKRQEIEGRIEDELEKKIKEDLGLGQWFIEEISGGQDVWERWIVKVGANKLAP
ncbi:MAG: hypothetical protein M1840_004012 [Geoglossum simile]|nr:MAG: hypothetical protein M1840_004012 [Geoglossum simile]